MPPDVPNENDIEHNDVEVTESKDVIETAAEVEPEMSKESSGAQPHDLPVLTTVFWFRQFLTVLRKNILLLSRRPLTLIVMLLSSVVSVLLAWAAGRPNPDYDFGEVPLTDCGTVSSTYYDNLTYTEQSETPISFNDAWRYGMPVTLLALGPLVTAIAAFLLVHEEMSQKMLGVLRGLGPRRAVHSHGSSSCQKQGFATFDLSSLESSLSLSSSS